MIDLSGSIDHAAGTEFTPGIVTQPKLSRPRVLGRGRSGIVYLDRDLQGRAVARKVFIGEGLSRVVLLLTSGAPNPYNWNKHAVRAAVYRRKILRMLVHCWFDDRLSVPETFGAAWNPRHGAFELQAEFIAGQHLPLRWCAQQSEPDPMTELTRDIMPPLQAHLIESGFDGMVWQAGLGNPVAGGNFMLKRGGNGQCTWFWIDLESGVPAIFPLNPLTLVRFYLPRSLRHRRLLFDDVDIPKLRRYLKDHGQRIERKLGEGAMVTMQEHVEKLAYAQGKWKSLDRSTASIAYFRRRGVLSRRDAKWYGHHAWFWRLKLLRLGANDVVLGFVAVLATLMRWFRNLKLAKWLLHTKTFFLSSRYRRLLARRYAMWRMRAWSQRQFIGPADIRQLRSELQHDHAGVCVTDFCVHLHIKPAVKFLQWFVFPLLFMLGVIQIPALVFLELFGGAIGRTVYTLYRCVESWIQRKPRPWVALAVGVLPVIGNLAFLMQFAYWCSGRPTRIAQFLLYDCFASLGRAVCIWGGENSLVEARVNRLPDLLLRETLPTRSRPLARTL